MKIELNDIYAMAEKALQTALLAGAQEVEVFGLTSRGIHVDIQKDKIDLSKESFVQGLGIKAVVMGAVGFSSTNNPGRIQDAAVNAVKSAGIRGGDPAWRGLPEGSACSEVPGIYDPRIAELGVDACIDMSMALIEGALSVGGAMPTSGKFSCYSSGHVILNSSSLEVKELSTRIDGFMDCRAGEAGEMATAFEFDISRNLDIDFYNIGYEAARQAVATVGGGSVEAKEMDVLLKPSAIADILDSAFLFSLSAENVQNERSVLTGKLGQTIAAGELNIIDDGLLMGGIGSGRTDDEGTPSRTNRIIENGVLCTYLYDAYSAGKEGVESTASAVRNNYAQTASIDIRNMKIEYPASDIVGETAYGVLIGSVLGAHTANPISGDFSVEARNSFLVKHGEIAGPIRSMMISGNVFELLQNICGAGDDVKVLGNIITPTIRVSGLKVVG